MHRMAIFESIILIWDLHIGAEKFTTCQSCCKEKHEDQNSSSIL